MLSFESDFRCLKKMSVYPKFNIPLGMGLLSSQSNSYRDQMRISDIRRRHFQIQYQSRIRRSGSHQEL